MPTHRTPLYGPVKAIRAASSNIAAVRHSLQRWLAFSQCDRVQRTRIRWTPAAWVPLHSAKKFKRFRAQIAPACLGARQARRRDPTDHLSRGDENPADRIASARYRDRQRVRERCACAGRITVTGREPINVRCLECHAKIRIGGSCTGNMGRSQWLEPTAN